MIKDRFLSGKSAVITGSTSGIGLAMAHAFAEQGANIMLNGLGDLKAHQALAQEIANQYQVKTGFHPANMLACEEIKDLVKTAYDLFGGVHILINNAGIQHVAPVPDFADEKWQEIIDINLSSNFYTIKAALPLMRQAGWGRIINIASVHGLTGSVQKSAYVAAKHGLVGLTKVVSLETAEEPITCNAICPGWTRTPLIEPQIKKRASELGVEDEVLAIRDMLKEKQPSKMAVETKDLAQLALFIASDAANQMTGSILPMDGGWTAQ